MQLFLVSVALATTTLVQQDTQSPVEKVVKLLTDMKDTLVKEEKSDEEAYEKLSCWCETNDKGKTAAIAEYEARVKELEAEIEERTKKAAKLEQEIAKTNDEIAQLKESRETAEKMRAKEAAENHASEVDLVQNIEALKGAITVLKKHQLTAFPQLHLDFLSVSSRSLLRKPDDLDKLSSWMEQHQFGALDKAEVKDVEQAVKGYLSTRDTGSNLNHYTADELAMLATAKRLVRNFMQSNRGHYQAYQNQSGEIFGILTQLKEQLEGDLSDTQKKEAQAAAQHADLMAQLKVQLEETEKHLKNKETQQADNSKALSDAKENLEDTRNNLDADTKFLVELKELCSKSDAEWEERAKTRKAEIAAVSEALQMLTADDARDLFSSTYSFVQIASSSDRARASAVLRAAGEKAKDKELVALSVSVQLDGFKKVKAAINDMIAALKQQQEDEVKHKDFCNSELHANDMETAAKEDAQADLETKIEGLENTIETLTAEIAAAKAAVADLEVQQQRASEDRIKESKVFQQTIEDQRATQQILAKVLSRLNEFYTLAQTGKAKALLQQTPQEEAYKQKNVVPPVKFDEYKKNAGGSSVLTLIGNLITDAKNLEKEAIGDENDAQQAYEAFVKSTNDSRSAKEQEAVDKTELKATAETEKEQATEDHKAVVADLAELAKYKADLHSACDFVLKNFDIRQKARGEEIEALQSALAILSGMQADGSLD